MYSSSNDSNKLFFKEFITKFLGSQEFRKGDDLTNQNLSGP